ncbi:MAG: DUF6220 domain-containing protein [Micromonosporaceae bacterium]
MRKVYVILAGLVVVAGILQFYFAAVGAFTSPQTDGSYALHSLTGMAVIPGLAVLATVAAALARAPWRMVAMTMLPFGLVIVQMLLVALGKAFSDSTGNSTPVGLAIVGLHGVNGMLVIGAAAAVLRRARAFAAPVPAEGAVAVPAGSAS